MTRCILALDRGNPLSRMIGGDRRSSTMSGLSQIPTVVDGVLKLTLPCTRRHLVQETSGEGCMGA